MTRYGNSSSAIVVRRGDMRSRARPRVGGARRCPTDLCHERGRSTQRHAASASAWWRN
jgi:hypothetical protein